MPIEKQHITEFSRFGLIAKQVVEGFLTGLHKSPFHGFSVEFAEHRLYNNGESIRHIDWKLFGRTERMYTKKYEEETRPLSAYYMKHYEMKYYNINANQEIEKINKELIKKIENY